MSVRESIIRIVANAFPQLAYGYARTYVVASVNGDKTLNLVPPIDAAGQRELKSVEQWTSGGKLATPSVGAEVLVVYRGALRTRPVAVAFAPGVPTALSEDTSGAMTIGASATSVAVAGGGAAVGRVGDGCGQLATDTTMALYYSPSTGPSAVYAPVASSGIVGVPVGFVGTPVVISNGSPKLTSG